MIDEAVNFSKITQDATKRTYCWDSKSVKFYTIRMDQLVADIKEVENDTILIQSQQEALQEELFKRAQFPQLVRLKTQLMPVIVQAWEVIASFNAKFLGWWTVYFPSLRVEEIEECNMDWTRKIDFIQKDEAFMNNKLNATFIEYITKQIDRLKEFMSIIIALKTRGLEKRHYTKMEKELQEQLEMDVQFMPSRITLKYL